MSELQKDQAYGMDLPAVLDIGECSYKACASEVTEQGVQLTLVKQPLCMKLDRDVLNEEQLGVTITQDTEQLKRRVKVERVTDGVVRLSFVDSLQKGSRDYDFLSKVQSSHESYLNPDIQAAKASDPENPFHGIYLLQRVLWRYGRILLFILGNILSPLISLILKPKVVFAVYGTKGDHRAYTPGWFRNVSPKLVSIGLFKSKIGWGMVVSSPVPENELAEDSGEVRTYIERLRARYSKADTFALVGRLPGFALRAGIPLDPPLVNGAFGTRFAMVESALQLAEKRGRPHHELKIAILGGAGRIGEPLISDLAKLFSKVIAIDPRYQEEIGSVEYGTQVLKTRRPERLYEADLVLVLTARGSDIENLVAWFKPDALVADDTHPCIKRPIRNKLANQGVSLYKTVIGADKFNMYPRMPNFNGNNIPGCLLEALVISEHGRGIVNDPSEFFEAAKASGYYAQLIKPKNDS